MLNTDVSHENGRVARELEKTVNDFMALMALWVLMLFVLFAATSCVVNGPMSLAYRSVSTLQTAETEGRTTSDSSSAAVNADKTTNAQVEVGPPEN